MYSNAPFSLFPLSREQQQYWQANENILVRQVYRQISLATTELADTDILVTQAGFALTLGECGIYVIRKDFQARQLRIAQAAVR